MIRLIQSIIVATVFIVGVRLDSQELEAFDLNDFLDPRLLIIEDSSGSRQSSTFFASRAAVGFLNGYQRRNLIGGSQTGYGFARFVGNLYFQRNQLNLEVTGLARVGIDDDEVTDARVQVARYFIVSANDQTEEQVWRVLFSYRTTNPDDHGFGDEVSLAFDVAVPGTEENPGQAFGGYVFTFQPDTGDYFLSLVERGTIRETVHEVRFDAGFGTGFEQVDGHTTWGHTRLELSLVTPIPRLFNSYLHVVYAPYYHAHPSEGQDSLGHELGLFLDFGVFSRLFGTGSRLWPTHSP